MWFFNLPPADNNLPQPEDRPPYAELDMTVSGQLHAGDPGELIIETGESMTTQLIVEFGIAKDGRVPFVEVRRSSGYPIYDDYAVNAIKFASPFPPVPDSISRTGFPINATFRYVVESSLTNLLR